MVRAGLQRFVRSALTSARAEDERRFHAVWLFNDCRRNCSIEAAKSHGSGFRNFQKRRCWRKPAMAFTTNIRIFRLPSPQHALSVSYRLLVAVELALKDANCGAGGGGHNVPGMLTVAANLPAATPQISGQLSSYALQLQTTLGLISCQGKNGMPTPVPSNSYPYLRYCRVAGDWGGVNETPPANLTDLEHICQNLCAFLSVHGRTLGVNL